MRLRTLMDDVDEMKLELEVGPTDRMMRNEMSDWRFSKNGRVWPK